nr:unnamed protein product [Callosobruchus analis]
MVHVYGYRLSAGGPVEKRVQSWLAQAKGAPHTPWDEDGTTACECPPPFTCASDGSCVYIPTTTSPSDSGNILANVQPRSDFNENNQPFIKETNIMLGYKVLRLLTLCLNFLNKTQCWTTLHKTHCLTAAPTGNMMRLWRLCLRWKLDMRILYHPKKNEMFEANKRKKKWENLIRTYKNTKDKKNKSGRCPVRFVYFDRLDELLGEKPNNCSPHTIDVGASTSSQAMETVASPVVADQVVENCPQQENIETRGKRKKKNVSSQYVELKKKYYDHKATVYEEYTKKKLALMKRKVVLEERKIIALETIAESSSKK